MSHITQPTKTEGGVKETRTSDDNVQELLEQILKELKKMNYHLSLMTDTNIRDQEVE